MLFNNLSVAISAGFLIVCLILSDESKGDSAFYLISLICAIGFCALSMAAASGEKTAFSKDYIVVMVSSLYESELQDTTSQSSTMVNSNEKQVAKYTKYLSSRFIVNKDN